MKICTFVQENILDLLIDNVPAVQRTGIRADTKDRSSMVRPMALACTFKKGSNMISAVCVEKESNYSHIVCSFPYQGLRISTKVPNGREEFDRYQVAVDFGPIPPFLT